LSEDTPKKFNGSLDDLLKEHVLAKTIIGEADKAGSVLRLSGYIGKSKSNRIIRLYLNLNFDEYVEIPKDSIIYATTTPPGVLEFQGTYLWINRDTDITYTHIDIKKEQLNFLRGRLSRKYLRKVPSSKNNRADSANVEEEVAYQGTYYDWPCYTMATCPGGGSTCYGTTCV
jgi:hypothetical protein